MKKWFSWFRWVLLCLLICASSFGQSFYVRAGASGAGSDWSNAFSALPATLVRGATYYVADGSYPNYVFDDPVSGTQLITIKKATDADHGTSVGWQPSYGDGTAIFSQNLHFRTGNYRIDGQSRTGWRSGYGIKIDNRSGNSHAVLLGLPFQTSVQNITLRFVEIEGTGRQDDAVNDRGIQVSLNSSGFTVSYCWLHDFDETPLMMHRVSNILVEHSVIERNDSSPAAHSEGVVASEGCNNFTFRYNIMSDIEGTAFIATPVGGHPGCAGTVQRDWFIYGNLFVKPASPLRATTGAGVLYIFDAQHQGELDFYNNSIVNVDNGFVGFETADLGGGCGAKMRVQNNIWYSCTFGVNRTTKVTDLIWSHNSYFDVTTSDPDSNKEVRTGSPFRDWAGSDFHLVRATAPGVSVPYLVDLDGVRRGADGVWDRGAYEFGGGPDLSAPVISAVNSSSITTSGASISWTTDEAANSRVEYGTTTAYGSVITNSSSVTAHTVSLVGLNAGTTYNYRVMSTDAAGNTRASANFTFTTLVPDSRAPAIATVTASSVGPSSATVSWVTDESATGGVDYGVTTSYGSVTNRSNLSTSHSITLQNLNPSATYHYRVRATDSVGNTATSGDFTFTTAAADTTAPSVSIIVPAAGAVLSGQAVISATAADSGGVAEVRFYVDATLVGAGVNNGGNNYGISWNTLTTANGNHTLHAVARDNSGNERTSGIVNISIQNTAPDLRSGLVGYWPFDEESGTQTANVVNPGTGVLQSGVSRVSGVFAGGLAFNGTVAGHVVVPDSAPLRIGGSITLAMWVKHTTVPTSSGMMYYLEKGLDDHDNYGIGIQGTTSGSKMFFEFEDSLGVYHHFQQSGSTTLTANEWVHIALTFDDANNIARFYRDGMEVGSVAVTQSMNGGLSQPLHIGRENMTGFEWPFSGAMDDLRIYNRALSLSAVTALFQARPPTTPGGLVIQSD
jgi:hypothetical protein